MACTIKGLIEMPFSSVISITQQDQSRGSPRTRSRRVATLVSERDGGLGAAGPVGKTSDLIRREQQKSAWIWLSCLTPRVICYGHTTPGMPLLFSPLLIVIIGLVSKSLAASSPAAYACVRSGE